MQIFDINIITYIYCLCNRCCFILKLGQGQYHLSPSNYILSCFCISHTSNKCEIKHGSHNNEPDSKSQHSHLRTALTEICTVAHINKKAVEIIGVINDIDCFSLPQHFGIFFWCKAVFDYPVIKLLPSLPLNRK